MTSRSLAWAVAAVFAPVAGCGSHHHDDDEPYRTVQADAGTSPPSAGRTADASAASSASSTSASTTVRCAPGADCNGLRHCYDGEYVVTGNGTCTVDCNCHDHNGGLSANGVGTLVCDIGNCR